MRKIVKSGLLIILVFMSILFLVDCKNKNKNNNNNNHVHEFTHFEYNDSTCINEGNIEYWQCTSCNKLFSDNNGENEISKNDTVILIKSHIDDDHNYKCDYQCGTTMIDNEDISNIIENTFALQEAKLESYDIPHSINTEYYAEEGLIYYNDESIAEYFYDNKLFIKGRNDINWSKIKFEGEVEYNLGYYFKNNSFDFSIKEEVSEITGYYGKFQEIEGFEFINNSNHKIMIFINYDKNILDGIQIKNAYDNIICEVTITIGKISTYEENILKIIEELKYENCEEDNCEGKLIDGICNLCNSYQKAVLTSDLYDINDDGNKDSVYEIYNPGQLYWFSELVNSGETSVNGILMNDIILNENVVIESKNVPGKLKLNEGTFREWNSIGYYRSSNGVSYNGVFDGNNYSVSGVYINNDSLDTVGLFGYCGDTAIIKNLTVVNSYIVGRKWLGGIAGYFGGTISNCSVNEVLVETNNLESCVGGIIGNLDSGKINKCFTIDSDISGINYVGGIVGTSYGGVIENCYNTSLVQGNQSVGGIVGQIGYSKIYNSFNTEYINKDQNNKINIGSICGNYYDTCEILNCYYLENTYEVGIHESNYYFEITKITNEQLKSGEITYLLQNNNEVKIWGQNLDNGKRIDELPNFTGDTVYSILDETTNTVVYTNINN